MDVQAHLRRCHQAVQRWEEVVNACRLQRCEAWEHFRFSQRLQARRRQGRRIRCVRNLQMLWQRLPGRRWWVYPRSSDWWDNFVMRIWGEEKWLENFRMSSPYTPHLGRFLPAQATMGDRRINTLDQEDCCSGIRSTFDWLVDALRDVLQRQRTEMRAPVSVERRVAVALWWMASTMSYRTVAHQFGLARSTVAGIVVEVTRAITEALLDRVVYLRDPDKGFASDMVFKPPTHLKCEARTNLDAWNYNNGPMEGNKEQDLSYGPKRRVFSNLFNLDPVVVVSSPTDGEAESPPTDSDAESAHSSGGEQAEASPPREEGIPPEEEVLVVAEEHPRVEISSATEGEAGEVQVPGPGPRPEPAQPSGQSPLQREVEDLRRTVKRLNYRLGFLERSHKRVRHILQRSQAMSRQQQRRSQDPQQAQQEGPPTV
ncbi:UNVERIFIED_CONTAM: hypothetical protein K2H54_047789 [Gekko kuhli]